MLALLLVVFWVPTLVAWPTAIVSAARHSSNAYFEVRRTRPATIWLIVLVGGVGALYYWLRIHPQLRTTERLIAGIRV